ncbi:helix-turn-helix domain-containing protein [Nocardioides zhouii]|uniref:ImmA/IrrE family metallo-endopeptidase n=1 Tax=Nocardioides zhouii TaxID=1168729 RepID=A0A4Q2T674_9ACTN|nr:XRE family transcriptional regulator [Nocardioides zhouii]RYC12484.1 ImmA/IrrE family metallo-endopeptidase [Nocardioides zhouii]
MSTMSEVGDRIRAAMPFGMNQRQLADRAGMTPDALSRALNGQRGLSPLEVAKIAKTLGADTHWLITGAPDPFAITVAARHAWDIGRRERHNPGKQDDQSLLDRVVGLYRAAFPQGPTPSAVLPSAPTDTREQLGPEFVRDFADKVEQRLNIDVIRIPGLKTDYSLRVGERGVIVLATQASWFRSNWSLAHELGHLALGHHSTYNDSARRVQSDEKAADAFAAQLLISQHDIDEVGSAETEGAVARAVWRLGISTEAMRNRLASARMQPNPAVTEALRTSTPRLLRANALDLTDAGGGTDQVAAREQAASARRFPLALLSALQTQTELGAASPAHLSWALDVPIDDIEFPEPDEDAAGYERMVAERPSASRWRSLITGAAQI